MVDTLTGLDVVDGVGVDEDSLLVLGDIIVVLGDAVAVEICAVDVIAVTVSDVDPGALLSFVVDATVPVDVVVELTEMIVDSVAVD